MSPRWWELVALSWAVRVLGALALLTALVVAAWWLAKALLRAAGEWRALLTLSRMWFLGVREDREKLRRAVAKWDAWQHDEERARAVEAETERLRSYYQQREAFLRAHYGADDMPEDTEPAAAEGMGTDGRDDLV